MTVWTNHNHKSNPIFALELVTKYYFIICSAPLYTSLLPKVSLRLVLISMYIFSRVLGFIKFTYELLLALGLFEAQNGPNDTFGLIEAFLYALGMLPYVACDILFLNREFLLNVPKLFAVLRAIHDETAKVPMRCAGHSARYRTLRTMTFIVALDYFQYIFTFVALQGTMMERSNVYSVIPWKGPVVEGIAWFLESYNLAVLFFMISMMTTLPGVYAYYIEEALKKMTSAVYDFMDTGGCGDDYKDEFLWRIMGHYRNLQYISREINKTMGMGVMSFNTTNCTQQTAETFCVFQFLKMGATFEDVQFLLTDLIISATRCGQCFNAMSGVYGAAGDFLEAIHRCLALRCSRRSEYERKLVRVTLRSFRRISMKIGNFNCRSNFCFEGMSVYLDNYFTAALWP